MGMIFFGLRNLLRSKSRLALMAVLIGAPFFLLLAMQSIGEAVDQQTAEMNRNVNTVLQLRARGSMGHVNMTNQDRLLPDNLIEKVRAIEHITRIEHAQPTL